MSVPLRVEVAAEPGNSSKHKGDLLEQLTENLLTSQSYEVSNQLRVTGVELDLVAKHKVSGQNIYVECKAHRDSLKSEVITKLLGTLELHDEYQEGWLVTAGPLGKDAKGVWAEWKQKPQKTRSKLTVYTPEKLVLVLVNCRIVVSPETIEIPSWCKNRPCGDEVILLITEYGMFWARPILSGGVPEDVLIYHAKSGQLCSDLDVLRRLAATDTTLKSLGFELGARQSPKTEQGDAKEGSEYAGQIIEVKHGESWDDYRPARPTDFVGRDSTQQRVLDFLDNVRKGETITRVFAITGDTGMGKSSLVVKLRDRLKNARHRKNSFFFAVDVRAARGPQYVLRALLACLEAAQKAGHGVRSRELAVSDLNDPLRSPTIEEYLSSLRDTGTVIALILDQFEELYSKPDLFPVFQQAERLFLSATSNPSNLVMGFVLRSDSTVPQDHPAYHMWHRLADHRLECRLRVFSPSETSKAITLFEKELGQKLRPELRRQISENCEGYPWLLKKLCIHLHDQIQSGTDQADLTETMDVGALFASDLNSCSQAEVLCLEHVARQAPADFVEVLDCFGKGVIDSLQDKRLILRSGDRLNLYWDVFREYVLTKKVPSIPSTYLPSSPSIGAFLTIAGRLSRGAAQSSSDLARETGLSVKTVGNVIHDLTMFGLAKGTPSAALLEAAIEDVSEQAVLSRVRDVLKRHALTREIQRFDSGARITLKDMMIALKAINPTARHSSATWEIYAKRLGPWLIAAGLLESCSDGWIWRDQGGAVIPSKRGSRFRLGCFQADAPPFKVVSAYLWLMRVQPCTYEQVKASGNRNAVRILDRFEFTDRDADGRIVSIHDALTTEAIQRLVYEAASQDETIREVLLFLDDKPSANGVEIGQHVSRQFQQPWNLASQGRNGNALRIWASWVAEGQSRDSVPPPPGPRSRSKTVETLQSRLFPDDQSE